MMEKHIDRLVYLNVPKAFVKTGLESRAEAGKTFNMVTLPKGVKLDGRDLSGAKMFPLDRYIYTNKFNKNLTTVQFRENQKVLVSLASGKQIEAEAKALAKAVDIAREEYFVSKEQERQREDTKGKDSDKDKSEDKADSKEGSKAKAFFGFRNRKEKNEDIEL